MTGSDILNIISVQLNLLFVRLLVRVSNEGPTGNKITGYMIIGQQHDVSMWIKQWVWRSAGWEVVVMIS